MANKRLPLTLLLLWTLVILMAGMMPLSDFVGHSHWEYIKWFPNAEDLQSPKYLLDILSDIIGNIVLFFPLGYFLGKLLSCSISFRQLILSAVIGGTLSLTIEFYQVYCHSRFPSIFDVITNVTGTIWGARYVLNRKRISSLTRNPALTPIPPDHTPAP